jgi:hypothetical protein
MWYDVDNHIQDMVLTAILAGDCHFGRFGITKTAILAVVKAA